MGFEIIKDKDDTYSIWNTVISQFEIKGLTTPFHVANYMVGRLVKERATVNATEERMKMWTVWYVAAKFESQPIHDFLEGLVDVHLGDGPEELSQCPGCHCMTKTITLVPLGSEVTVCGKCGRKKE
jgi:hypothetical protein